MSKELSKNLVCLSVRNGVEIWMEENRAANMMNLLRVPNPPQFLEFEGRLINKADLVGVFTASDMEDVTRRKNGQWKCDKSTWHDKGERCECIPSAERSQKSKRFEAYTKCGKCHKGWMEFENSETGQPVMVPCECQSPFLETK